MVAISQSPAPIAILTLSMSDGSIIRSWEYYSNGFSSNPMFHALQKSIVIDSGGFYFFMVVSSAKAVFKIEYYTGTVTWELMTPNNYRLDSIYYDN